jgi:protein disulfide-isomerase
MKNILIFGVFLLFAMSCSANTQTDSLDWHTDLNKVQQMSKKTGKPIFAFFTGSDWCGWCTKLHRDVFAKPEFVKWANEKVILLELDYPRRKTLPTELAKQNAELQQAFGIRGYPTIWMFFINEKENNQKEIAALGSLGYPSGAVVGQEQVKFLEEANKILLNGKK